MTRVNRELVVFCDIDGTQNYAPPPIKTAIGLLLKGRINLPSSDKILKPANKCDPFTYWFHRFRPFTADSRKGLELLKEVVDENYGRVKLGVLSGRDPGMHSMTLEQLVRSGRGKFFDGVNIRLCLFNSSSGYKESVAREKIKGGSSVILIDDDAKASLMFARSARLCCDDQVADSYLLSNITNGGFMLRNTELPSNIRLVPSFLHAARDIASRIRSGSI